MKIILPALAAFALCLSQLRATPSLDISILQEGENVTLNWNILKCDPGGSAAIRITGLFNDVYTGNFLGWFNRTSGELNGTVSRGWLDFPAPDGMDHAEYIMPYPTSRFSGIFAEGEHIFYARYYLDEHPMNAGPDGMIEDGGFFPHIDLESTFRIASVPDAGSTLLLLGMALPVMLLLKRRSYSSPSLPELRIASLLHNTRQ